MYMHTHTCTMHSVLVLSYCLENMVKIASTDCTVQKATPTHLPHAEDASLSCDS